VLSHTAHSFAGTINHFAALPEHFISQREQEAEPNAFQKAIGSAFL
jgi:hypothetical protein